MLVTLTENDKAILRSYKYVIQGIAQMWGSNTEVVLHSLDADNPSVVSIANGHVTDRDEGAPITDLALEKLDQGINVSEPYFSRNRNGDLLRSITSVIRNADDTAIGVLCINMDLETPMHTFFSALLPQTAPDISPENFAQSSQDMVEQAVARVKSSVLSDPSISPNRRNKTTVLRLNEKGIFNVANAVNIVADRLEISSHSIYRYLRQVK